MKVWVLCPISKMDAKAINHITNDYRRAKLTLYGACTNSILQSDAMCVEYSPPHWAGK